MVAGEQTATKSRFPSWSRHCKDQKPILGNIRRRATKEQEQNVLEPYGLE